MSKKAVALKLLTNRKVRQGAVGFLKDPRADKKTLALKLLSNPKMRQGAVELLKDPDVRTMLLQQTAQRLRRRRKASAGVGEHSLTCLSGDSMS